MLSTMLPGCAKTIEVPVDKHVPVAVEVKDTPPADLLRCAERPAPLPEDDATVALLPRSVRAALIGIARAFGVNAAQLDRLVNWQRPGSCPAPTSASAEPATRPPAAP